MTTITVSGEALWRWCQDAQKQVRACHLEPTFAAQLLRELDWLLQEISDLDRLALQLQSFKERAQIPLRFSLNELSQLWQQRIQKRIPIQQLVGVTPWRQFSLQVTPNVLIPRPETELIVDLAASTIQRSMGSEALLNTGNWADLGTGSGAIALALAHLWPTAMIHAVDYSATALEVAKANANALGLTPQIQFYQGDWLTPLAALKGQLHGIVSNPPYIPSAMVPQLQPEVAWHEPHLALDGGTDGLSAIREIVGSAGEYLRSGGVLIFEMMMGQSEEVICLLNQQGTYEQITIHPDLAGIDRFAQAYRI